ncbi:MAG: oligopeptide transporter, OPT family, partial [Bacteroidota bacterium]
LYFSLNLSPALVAVGYIVGLNIAFLVFLGGCISWYLGIPIYILLNGAPDVGSPEAIGGALWSSKIRYLGVGAMVVGGVWALLSLRSALGQAFSSGVAAFKARGQQLQETLRTELDAPMSWIFIGVGVILVPVFFIYYHIIQGVPVTLFMLLIMVIAGFLFSAVAGYMAGLVGSSNNPISGVTIATVLSTSLLLLLLIGSSDPGRGAAGAILVGAVIACAAAIAGDNMQDLKAGHVLGSTPKNQQIMQLIGVIAGALLIAPVLNLLLESKGIGAPTPEFPDPLTAPQATLMMSVATGIFGGELPWNIIAIGGTIGAIIIVIDQYLKSKGSTFRMPVLAVAVGLYLPFELDSSIFVGGVLAWLLEKGYKKLPTQEFVAKASNAGLLIASGLITGEALMGILVALFASFGISMAISDSPVLGSYGGLLLLAIVIVYLYRTVKKVSNKGE